MVFDGPLERIGRYQVLERVGKGGMGVLYRAFDPILDREVAIKLTIADFTRDSDQMRPRFYREARAAAKLNHRNIVTIFEFAEESNVPYIVMELLHGMPLGTRMSVSPRLTLDDKLHIVSQLCDGLAYAHAQGVVHRDVKPDNVFVTEDGTVKLLDFGIAKLTASNLTVEGDMLGSASYMSPEQVSQSESVDGRADVFSAGVVLYELLTGHRPFEADTPTAVILKILNHPPTPMDTYVKGLPLALCAAVEKAIEKDPANRFATADLLSKELQSIRRALEQQARSAELDDTRFADTIILKSLSVARQHADDESQSAAAAAAPAAATPPASARQESPAPASPATGHTSETSSKRAAAASGPSWLMPALAAGVLAAVATAFLTLSARQATPPAPEPTAEGKAVGGTTPSTGTVAPTKPPTTSAQTTTPPTSQETATSASESPLPPAPPVAAPVPMVRVTMTGDYPFEVRDGHKVLSAANTAHSFRAPAGRTLEVLAPKYFLKRKVVVEGSSTTAFAWAAPGLGNLSVRSSQETCDVMIEGQNAGNPPIANLEIAAGSHRIEIWCGGTVLDGRTYTVPTDAPATVAIR